MSARDVSPFVGWHCTGVFGHRKMQCSEPCAWCRDEAAKNEAALTAAGYAVVPREPTPAIRTALMRWAHPDDQWRDALAAGEATP